MRRQKTLILCPLTGWEREKWPKPSLPSINRVSARLPRGQAPYQELALRESPLKLVPPIVGCVSRRMMAARHP
jgi:hypothetical protein